MRTAPAGLGALRALLTLAAAAGLGACARAPGSGAGTEAGRPLPAGTTVTPRGHQELVLGPGGDPVPLYLGCQVKPGVCLETPPETDSSQWQAAFSLGGRPAAAPAPPTARSGPILCFATDWPPELPEAADLELCGRIVDRWDGAVFDFPCRRIRYQAANPTRSELLASAGEAVAARHDGSRQEFLDTMEELAGRARATGLLWLGSRIELIAAHYLIREGETEDLAAARRLLSELPPWVERPEASALGADAAHLAGNLELIERWDLQSAWRHYRDAEQRYRRILERKRLAAARGQAEILARVGAVRDGALLLRRALADCAEIASEPAPPNGPRASCSALQILDTRGLLAWLTLLDPDASRSEEEEAGEILLELAGAPSLEPQERANHLINLALLRTRRGEDAASPLVEAEGLLAPLAAGSRRSELLYAWTGLVEALAALGREGGDLARALARCEALVTSDLTPRLTAWALSCAGRIHRRRGDLGQAAWAFDRALAYHEHASPERLGQLLPLGPGQRASDFYRAARVALEQGRGRRAWEILTDLDGLTASEEACRRCRGSDEPPARRREREHLLRRLATLDAPAGRPGDRTALRTLVERLRELAAPCTTCAPAAARDRRTGYRAFALDDEIFLLRRDPQQRLTLVRRSPLPRGALREITDRLARALDERTAGDTAWRALAQPLAAALAPELPAGAATAYSLHGLLQSVPLEALPLASEGGDTRWLGEVTTVVVRPAAAEAGTSSAAAAAPLFVVDPAQNLARRDERVAFYRRHFPGGRLLAGGEATVAAFRLALSRAAWLHADTHGFYDPAFPEHSSLELADGVITLAELGTLPLNLAFANLSGCRTGSWPTTADSGRYGIGGLLARRGARWVIASRADLLDRLALDFNPPFYRALHAGLPVPEAYGRAMSEVRSRHPASVWAALFLLGGPPGEGEGGKGKDRRLLSRRGSDGPWSMPEGTEGRSRHQRR